jgi:hypothetical protein
MLFGLSDRDEMDDGSIHRILRDLDDRRQIHDAIMRYCRGIDRRDGETLFSAYHEDAVDNHTGTEVPVAVLNPQMLRTLAESFGVTAHNITNEYVEFLGGDRARSEAYFMAIHRITHEQKLFDWLLAGRYLDEHERRNGRWRIVARRVVYDWERIDEVNAKPQGFPFSIYSDSLHGRPDRADPSFKWPVR